MTTAFATLLSKDISFTWKKFDWKSSDHYLLPEPCCAMLQTLITTLITKTGNTKQKARFGNWRLSFRLFSMTSQVEPRWNKAVKLRTSRFRDDITIQSWGETSPTLKFGLTNHVRQMKKAVSQIIHHTQGASDLRETTWKMHKGIHSFIVPLTFVGRSACASCAGNCSFWMRPLM